MFQVNVSIDMSGFTAQVDAHLAEDLVPYLSNILDQIADGAVAALVEAQAEHLDRPTPFTQKGWVKGRTKPGPGGTVVTDVHLLPIQAEYLVYALDGGVRVAGDYATTSLGPLIPGRDAKLNAYGNLPRGYVERMLKDPDVAWVHLRPGHPPALIRHKYGQPLEILALIVEKATYQKKLDIEEVVSKAVTDGLRRLPTTG